MNGVVRGSAPSLLTVPRRAVRLLALFGCREHGNFWVRRHNDLAWMWREARKDYLRQIKLCHPDNGGSSEEAIRLNLAWARLTRFFGRHCPELRVEAVREAPPKPPRAPKARAPYVFTPARRAALAIAQRKWTPRRAAALAAARTHCGRKSPLLREARALYRRGMGFAEIVALLRPTPKQIEYWRRAIKVCRD